MPTRIPIYRDDIFKRLDDDKKEFHDSLDIIKKDVKYLLKLFDKVMELSKKK